MVPITIANGVYKPAYNWGAPPCSMADLRQLAKKRIVVDLCVSTCIAKAEVASNYPVKPHV